GLLNFGRPTKGAALALVARLRLIHASPLYNGGAAARSYFGNWMRKTDGVHYVSQQYDETRWAVAAAAAKRAMDMGQYKLYTVPAGESTSTVAALITSVLDIYGLGPRGWSGIGGVRSYWDMSCGEAVAAINAGIIWGRSASYLN